MKNRFSIFSFLFCLATGITNAQFTSLKSFTNDAQPMGALTLSDGMLYGMASDGGTHNYGYIFSINRNGSNFTTLWNFNDTGVALHANGSNPNGSLTLFGNKFYGMTFYGGPSHNGNIFSINKDGSGYKDLWDFDGGGDTNGKWGIGSLIVVGKKLYGMTELGGTQSEGNIFCIDTNGSNYKNLWNFDNGGDTNGSRPFGDLTLSPSGTVLYGMTNQGGTNSYGNIFSIDTNGSHYKNLLSFGSSGTTNGSSTYGSLTLSASGTILYGMSIYGGTHSDGNVFSIQTNGSNYKDLLDFSGTDGEYPHGTLTLIGNTLYGTTAQGGVSDSGNIFSIDTNGTNYRNIFSFNGTNGQYPETGDLTISGDTIFGMTLNGGTNYSGTIYSFIDNSIPLATTELPAHTNKFDLYPNPNNGAVTISIKNYESGITDQISVYNMLGEVVYNTNLTQSISNFSLPNPVPGIYLYRILDKTGNIQGTGKFIVG